MENEIQPQVMKKLNRRRKKKKKSTKRIDFLQELPDEISYRVLQHMNNKHLVKCSLVSKNWNRLANDDLLWYEKSNEVCMTYKKYRSGWKALYFAKQTKEKLTPDSKLFVNKDPNQSYAYFSGNSCTSHNHPSIFAYGDNLTICGKGIFLEIPMCHCVEALNLFAMLLKKRKYHPKFRIGNNNNYHFEFNKKERMIEIKKEEKERVKL
ncbi:f-box only protein [Anaeramoeba flamelloides]|uniref:F-box only protein n=1 Tax=Anaeramoeba flamelloides TaxID=1746091 RepID=A0AAV7YVH2_9EUKA|nr:f-box only protein [Anaeramoeba flamelloides]